MSAILTKSAIDKLGKRLAGAAMPAPQDRQMLSDFLASHWPALTKTASIVEGVLASAMTPGGPPLQLAQRVKTEGTLIEKLRRGTKLSRMQDIAGVRIVGDVGLTQQDHLVQSICAQLGGQVDDRRAAPSHGYRAVHIVTEMDGRGIEIQVRTLYQHLWADATEALADQWGRGIRYGQPPLGDHGEVIERSASFQSWLTVAARPRRPRSCRGGSEGASHGPRAGAETTWCKLGSPAGR